MNCKQYKEQLLKLLENENNVSFFCELINDSLWDDCKARKEMLDYVIKFCKKNELDEALAWMYYFLGWHHYEFSNYKTSINLHNTAKDIFIKGDNKKGLVYAYNGLLSIYCQNGQYELANELGMKGVSIAKTLGENELTAKLFLNTSITNILAGSYEYAKEILEYIVNTQDYSGFTDKYKVVYNKALAEVEINLGNYENAFKCLQEGIESNGKFGANGFTSELHKLLGCYYGKMHNIKEAEKEFEYSCLIAVENNYMFEKCEALIEWAKFQFDNGNNDKAVYLLDEAIKISDENRFIRIIKNSTILLYEYYNNIKDYEKALANLELHIKFDYEIQNFSNTNYLGDTDISNNEMKLNRILEDKTEILSSIGQKIISNLDVKKMIEDVYYDINKLIKVDYFGINIYDYDTNELVLTSMDKNKLIVSPPMKLETNSTFSAYCIKTKKPIVISDIRLEYKKYVNKISLKDRGVNSPLSNVYVPLIIKDEVIGVMTVQSLKVNAYDIDDVNRLKIIANYIAIALKNAIKYERMEQVAVYDSLTGFLTKRELLKEGNKQVERFKNTQENFCIAMIDMDDFKKINDTFGHVIGDQTIKMITQTIGKQIRATDYIGRYGGDEFLLVCPDTTSKIAYKLADKIRKTVEITNYIINDDSVINITLSIGIYEFNDKELTFSDGISRADSSMYEAKRMQKNKVVMY